MGNPRCQWVRDRLPLLAGEELRGLDLRKVERHLIGCPKCRHHRASLNQALNVLHAASAHSPVPPDAPSVWPAVARQIRESRRPAQAPAFSWPRRLGWFGPAFAAALALPLVYTVIFGSRRPDAGPRSVVNASPSVAPAVPLVPAPPVLASEVPDPARGETASKPQTETANLETVPAGRVAYDLDHALPVGNEAREREKTH